MRGMSVFILTRRAITSRSSLFKKNPDNGRNLVMLLEHLVTPLEYSPPRGVLSSLVSISTKLCCTPWVTLCPPPSYETFTIPPPPPPSSSFLLFSLLSSSSFLPFFSLSLSLSLFLSFLSFFLLFSLLFSLPSFLLLFSFIAGVTTPKKCQ